MNGRHLLHALQDVEAAPAAVAFHGVGGIRDELELAQDELRDDKDAVHKTGLADIRNAPVDDDAGIQDLVILSGLALTAEQSAQRRKVEEVTLVGAQDQADVSHEQQQGHLEERKHAPVDRGEVEQVAHHESAENSQDGSHRGPDQALQAGLLKPNLEKDEEYSQPCAQQSGHP